MICFLYQDDRLLFDLTIACQISHDSVARFHVCGSEGFVAALSE